MTTKPLIRQLELVTTPADDTRTINRLIAAAAINTRFRSSLLSDPKSAIQAGFNGEKFHLTQATLKSLTSIGAHNLQDFVHNLKRMGISH